MDTLPAIMLMIVDGTKNGDTRRGPDSSSTLCWASMLGRPPMPEPMETPTRSRSSPSASSSPAWRTAWAEAAMPYCTKRSIFLTSLDGNHAAGSKPRTEALKRVA